MRKVVPEKVDNGSFDLVLTSPPFNTGKPMYDIHNDSMSEEDYLDLLISSAMVCEKALKKGGHMIYNLPPMVGRAPPRMYSIYFMYLMDQKHRRGETELWFAGIKNWLKGEAGRRFQAVGSKYGKPSTLDDNEWLIIFRKGYEDRNGIKGELPDSQMIYDMIRTWIFDKPPLEIRPETRGSLRNIHKALFPEELVEKVLENFTRKNEMVLDPFGGLGTTLRVAKRMQRSCITVELSPLYANYIDTSTLLKFVKDEE